MGQGPIATTQNVPASAALGITAAVNVKVGGGRLWGAIIVAPGTSSGAFTINDAASTTDAATANEIWSQAYNATPAIAGQIINFMGAPFTKGLTVSAVPGSGSPQITLLYT